MKKFYALQDPLPPVPLHLFTSFSERLSPAVRSKVLALALAFEAKAKMPGIWAVSLETMTLNEVVLTFPGANEEQLRGLVFLVVMQTLHSIRTRSLGFFATEMSELRQMKLQELWDTRSKVLETLANVMAGLADVRKTFVDNLK